MCLSDKAGGRFSTRRSQPLLSVYPTFLLQGLFLEKGIFIPVSAGVLHTTNFYYKNNL